MDIIRVTSIIVMKICTRQKKVRISFLEKAVHFLIMRYRAVPAHVAAKISGYLMMIKPMNGWNEPVTPKPWNLNFLIV